MDKNLLWDCEEFEDIIVRSFIGLYETKNLTNKYRRHKSTKVTPKDIAWARSIGCYFPPDDRVAQTAGIDIDLDGLPPYASNTDYTMRCANDNDIRDFIDFRFARKIKRLPSGFKPRVPAYKAFYQLITWSPQIKEGAYMTKEYFAIDRGGFPWYAVE